MADITTDKRISTTKKRSRWRHDDDDEEEKDEIQEICPPPVVANCRLEHLAKSLPSNPNVIQEEKTAQSKQDENACDEEPTFLSNTFPNSRKTKRVETTQLYLKERCQPVDSGTTREAPRKKPPVPIKQLQHKQQQTKVHDDDNKTTVTRHICITKHKRATDKTGLRFHCVEKEGSIIKIDRVAPDGIFANTELKPGMTLLRVNRVDIRGWELAHVMEIIRNTHGELTLEVEWDCQTPRQDAVANPAKLSDDDVPSLSWRRAKGLARLDQGGDPTAVPQQNDDYNHKDDHTKDRKVPTDSWRRLKHLPNDNTESSRPTPTIEDNNAAALVGTTTLQQDREERIKAKIAGLQSDSLQIRKQAWAARAEVAAAQVRSYDDNGTCTINRSKDCRMQDIESQTLHFLTVLLT